jgi:hypothetical protein
MPSQSEMTLGNSALGRSKGPQKVQYSEVYLGSILFSGRKPTSAPTCSGGGMAGS